MEQLPQSHFELMERYEWMDEIYKAVWEAKDGDYSILANGLVHTRQTSGQSDFGWKVIAVDEPGQTGEMILLTWTDHVANDWGEWFFGVHAFTKAFRRLSDLIVAVYEEDTMMSLEVRPALYEEHHNLGPR